MNRDIIHKQIWKSIKGYEDLYEISNCGAVRSLTRVVAGKNNSLRTLKGRILKPHEYRGYLTVELSKDGDSKKFKIHRLVAEAFVQNVNNLPQVNHKDENKLNNRADNLEWCTPAYNSGYGTRVERANSTKGCKPFICLENGKRYSNQTACAKDLSINLGNLNSVLYGNRKSTNGYHFEFLEEREGK